MSRLSKNLRNKRVREKRQELRRQQWQPKPRTKPKAKSPPASPQTPLPASPQTPPPASPPPPPPPPPPTPQRGPQRAPPSLPVPSLHTERVKAEIERSLADPQANKRCIEFLQGLLTAHSKRKVREALHFDAVKNWLLFEFRIDEIFARVAFDRSQKYDTDLERAVKLIVTYRLHTRILKRELRRLPGVLWAHLRDFDLRRLIDYVEKWQKLAVEPDKPEETYSLRAELREELDINKMRHKYFMVRARKELFKKVKQQAKIRKNQTKIGK